MSTPTITPDSEDYGEAGRAAFVLVDRPAWGIQLPNATLYQEYDLPENDPWHGQPTVWFSEVQARYNARDLADKLESRYGIPKDGPTALRVVELEMDTDGFWKRPEVAAGQSIGAGYRPMNLDTEELAELPCGAEVTLSIAQARRVMRDHMECAGQITCKVRGRARATLSRAGVMKLNRSPHVWRSLDLPDMAR
ncbi:hypothetical protein [Nocardia acidivorans]|uniref:hypothetical protein n=1 Tax=Nocardia acidivorans TaxID=404580 RepID=UPI000A51D535|nr:hypothetical protein [Nocardia acidivorans]